MCCKLRLVQSILRSTVSHGFVAYSDHIPLLLNMDGKDPNSYRGSKPFRFEAIGVGNGMCTEIIEDSWRNGVSLEKIERVMEKIQASKMG